MKRGSPDPDGRDPASRERRWFLAAAASAPFWLALTAVGCGGESGSTEARQAPREGASSPPEPAMEKEAAAEPEAPAASEEAPPEQEAAAEAGAAPSGDALVTEIGAMSTLVAALKYQNESPKPDQRCEGCRFYTQTAEGRGKCTLFAQGLVRADGWCSSWAAAPEEA